MSQYIFVGKQSGCETKQRTDKDLPLPSRVTVQVIEVVRPENWNPEIVVINSTCAPTDDVRIYLLSKEHEWDSDYSPAYGWNDHERIELKQEILQCIQGQ